MGIIFDSKLDFIEQEINLIIAIYDINLTKFVPYIKQN